MDKRRSTYASPNAYGETVEDAALVAIDDDEKEVAWIAEKLLV